jgi:hypothetical protein
MSVSFDIPNALDSRLSRVSRLGHSAATEDSSAW